MEIERLQYTKDWKNPSDFPTIETSETKVRSDMQLLYDETRDYGRDLPCLPGLPKGLCSV